jgi:mono/diheme cytochrome c family protein
VSGKTPEQRTAICKLLVSTLWVLLLSFPLSGQTPEAVGFFRQNCVSCHTIGGGRLTGPDLKNVTQRKDRAWLVQFLQDPKAIIASGDPYALKLQQEARGVVMPTISGMTREQAEALLNMIEAESRLPKSQFAGSPISDRPFTAADLAEGRSLFWGTKRLRNGGPACASCHTVNGIGGMGGGQLGPDLSLVYERLNGRKGVGTWLLNPASPTMRPIFAKQPLQPDEIFSLLAVFEQAAPKGESDESAGSFNFLLLGMGGASIALVTLGAAWKGRFRGVRRSLVRRDGSRTASTAQDRGEE